MILVGGRSHLNPYEMKLKDVLDRNDIALVISNPCDPVMSMCQERALRAPFLGNSFTIINCRWSQERFDNLFQRLHLTL